MKAAVLHEFKRPLTIEEVDPPKPNAEEVLIQIEACGLRHSDVHVDDGDWTQFAEIVKKLLILGHETVGRVEKCPAVHSLQVGDQATRS
jgi:alcohol dehydrogenase, propanol-preferring